MILLPTTLMGQDGRGVGPKLLYKLPGSGSWDDWAVEAEGKTVRLRRLPDVVSPELSRAVERAAQLRSPHAVRVLGLTGAGGQPGVLLAAPAGINAAKLQAAGALDNPRLSVWIAREAARAWAELALDWEEPWGVSLDLEDVQVAREGTIHLEIFALQLAAALDPRRGQPSAVLAVAGLLGALCQQQNTPPEVARFLLRCRGAQGPADLLAMEDELARLFYRELSAEDEQDGQPALTRMVERLVAHELKTEGRSSAPPQQPDLGLTQAIAERSGPVVPQPFSAEDYELPSQEEPKRAPITPRPEARPSNSAPDRAAAPKQERRSVPPAKAAKPTPGEQRLLALTWFVVGFLSALVLVAAAVLAWRSVQPEVVLIKGDPPAPPPLAR